MILREEQRPPPQQQQAPAAADAVAMAAIEADMTALSARASERCDAVLLMSDECIGMVQAAAAHLAESNTRYKDAYETFMNVLRAAKVEHEFNKAVEDAVQGVLIAAAVALIAPEAVAGKLLMDALAAAATSSKSMLGNAGFRGLLAAPRVAKEAPGVAAKAVVGEIAEQGAGKVVDTAKPPGASPTDTASGAGPSAGDRYEMASRQLSRMIATLPAMGTSAISQKDLALGAAELAKEAVKLKAGEPAKWSAAEVETKAKLLKGADIAAYPMVLNATLTKAAMQRLKEGVMSEVKIEGRKTIERKLWLRWMASLGANHGLLDNDVIEAYLGPEGEGMFDGGHATTRSDTRDALLKARREWNEAHPDDQVGGEAPPRGRSWPGRLSTPDDIAPLPGRKRSWHESHAPSPDPVTP